MRAAVRPVIVLLWAALAGRADAGPISLRTDDGVRIAATEYGTGKRAVVLVHAGGRSAADWSSFGERLAAEGFRAVALDLRGHGGSPLQAPLTDDDHAKMPLDVKAAVGWLRKRGVEQVHLVGAELGANVALVAAVADEGVTSLVLLSPGLNHHGLKLGEPTARYAGRPLLVVHASDDDYGALSARFIAGKADDARIEIAPGEATGTRLLNRSPDVEAWVVDWLGGAHATAGAPATLTTGPAVDLPTRGIKLGD